MVAVERIVDPSVVDEDGKSALERGNPGEVPVSQGVVCKRISAEAMRQWNSVVIPAHQALTRIVGRVSVTQMLKSWDIVGAVGVGDRIVEAGGIVQRVTVSVREAEIQSVRGSFGQ